MNPSSYQYNNQNQIYYPISVPSADDAQPSPWSSFPITANSLPANANHLQQPMPMPIYPMWSFQEGNMPNHQFQPPPTTSDPWIDVVDKRSGRIYYWNTETNETTNLGSPKPSTKIVTLQQPQPQPQQIVLTPNQLNNSAMQSNYNPYAMNRNANYPDKAQSNSISHNKTFNKSSNNSTSSYTPRSKNYYGPAQNTQSSLKRKLPPSEADRITIKRSSLSEETCDLSVRFKCSFCSKLFKKLVGLEAHIKIVHPSIVSTLTFPLHEASAALTGIPFTKVSAPTTTVGSGTGSTSAVLESPGNAEFHCSVCQKGFKSSVALQQHSATSHVEASENSFQCLQCKKLFSGQVAMRQHFLAKHNIVLTDDNVSPSRQHEVMQSGYRIQSAEPNIVFTFAKHHDEDNGTDIQERAADGGAIPQSTSYDCEDRGDDEIGGVKISELDPVSQGESSSGLEAVQTTSDTTCETAEDIGTSDNYSSRLEEKVVTEGEYSTVHVEQNDTNDATLDIETLPPAHTTGDNASTIGMDSCASLAAPERGFVRELSCMLCSMTFKWPNHLKQHYMTRHHGNKSSAPVSYQGSAKTNAPGEEASAKNSTNTMESPGGDEIRCNLCNKRVKNLIGLQQHLAMKHSKVD